MAKKDNEKMYWIIAIVALVLFYYGGQQGWFSGGDGNLPPAGDNLPPSTNSPAYTSCSQVCSVMGFSQGYSFINVCQLGESKITYGYPNQAPILTCCCSNPADETPNPAGVCTETDGGNVPTTPGTTTASDGVARMDICTDSTHVQEYWCNSDGTWTGSNSPCDPGQTCLSSRSGGYCKTKSWSAGDTVVSGGGSGSTIGAQEGFAEIDLGDYGLATGGRCQLGAQLHVDWSYANSKCAGIMGTEGMQWQFFDSSGLEYEKIDASPTAWTVDLHPRAHTLYWDGHTNWRAYARHFPGTLPECAINYDYTVRVYIYECI